MPTYRDISITLQSQYDARTIPEYPPLNSSATSSPDKSVPPGSSIFSLPPSKVAEVYIPNYASSQLWIEYSCPFPGQRSETKYYYFKLFVKGRCLLSWGVGDQDSWAGKVAWGIFDGGSDFEGKKLVEKRAFFFPSDEVVQREENGFEIKVFRAKARKKENFSMDRLRSKRDADPGNGLRTRNAGPLHRGEPRTMYTYALIDALDQPRATFRWHCRTSGMLSNKERLSPAANSWQSSSSPWATDLSQEVTSQILLPAPPDAPSRPKVLFSSHRQLPRSQKTN